MFSLQQLAAIAQALQLAINSNKRAMNKSQSPEFHALYEQIHFDLEQARQKTQEEITKIKGKKDK